MQSLLSFLLFVPFMALVVLANVGERQRWARLVTLVVLAGVNFSLVGLAGLALLSELLGRLSEVSQPQDANWLLVALTALSTAAIASLPLIPAVRRWLARWLPIDAGSVVHTTALAFAVYLIGLSLGQMALIGDLANLAEMELSLTVLDVLLSGLPLLLFGLLGVGLFVRRGVRQTLQRLGLYLPTAKQWLLAAVMTGLLLAFDYAINTVWQKLDPAGFAVLESVTDQLFGGLMTVAGALVLGLSAGISEEVLFRGALQPRLGIVLASVLFSVGHMQYGLTVATLEIFVIGLVLGLVRNRTNTTTCILIHAGYNAVGVLLGLLKP